MDTHVRPALHFAGVEIDVRDGRLLRDGHEEHLRQKTFQVLLYLIEHRGRIVSKEELMAKVWPDTAVTDDAVVQCIVDLRRALGDDARNPRFIRTVPKRGYRFVASESPDVSTMELTVEATESVEYAVVEDTPAPDRRMQSLVVPALAIAVALISGVAWMTANDGLQTRQHAGASMIPIDSPTTHGEALRLYNEGLRLLDGWKPREAIEAFEKALAIDPQYAMARARIGYTHGILSYDAGLARPHLERAMEMSTRLSEHERQQVHAWLDTVNARYPEAIDRYRLILERWPTDVESHRNLAKLLAGEERIEEAINVLERARALVPRSPQILNGLGMYSLIGRHDESIAALRRYVEVEPSEANAWDSLGIALQWAGRYEESLEAYARALELRPDFAIARYHRAAVYVQLGRFRDAISDVQTCLNEARSPTDRARAFGTLAEIHRIRGDEASLHSAEAQIPAGSAWVPVRSRIDAGAPWKDDPSIWETARVYGGRGARPESRLGLYYEGYEAMRQGRTEEALDIYRRALRMRPLTWSVEPLETILADALFDLGRFEEAAAEFRRVLGINPNYARARLGLARSLDALGRTGEARTEYRRFLDLWKNADPDARDLIATRTRLAAGRAGFQ